MDADLHPTLGALPPPPAPPATSHQQKRKRFVKRNSVVASSQQMSYGGVGQLLGTIDARQLNHHHHQYCTTDDDATCGNPRRREFLDNSISGPQQFMDRARAADVTGGRRLQNRSRRRQTGGGDGGSGGSVDGCGDRGQQQRRHRSSSSVAVTAPSDNQQQPSTSTNMAPRYNLRGGTITDVGVHALCRRRILPLPLTGPQLRCGITATTMAERDYEDDQSSITSSEGANQSSGNDDDDDVARLGDDEQSDWVYETSTTPMNSEGTAANDECMGIPARRPNLRHSSNMGAGSAEDAMEAELIRAWSNPAIRT